MAIQLQLSHDTLAWLIYFSLGPRIMVVRFVVVIFATMFLSSGCEKKIAATDATAQSTPGSTKPLEAADLVGYDGKRLRHSVDRIKESSDKRNQQMEKMAGSGPDQ
jgi:hypothetical protein